MLKPIPMTRCVFFIFFLTGIFFLLNCNAQNQHEIDSMVKLLQPGVKDTVQMKLNRKIARRYSDNNQALALTYFERAKDIAVYLKRPYESGDNYYGIAYSNFCLGNLDLAVENYLQSIKYYEQVSYDPSLADAYLSVISVYCDMKNFSKAKEYFKKAERVLVNSKDSFQLCSLYSQGGNLFKRAGQPDSAFYFLHKGIGVADASHDNESKIVLLSNLSLAYKDATQYVQAKHCIDTALKLMEKSEDNVGGLAMLHNNLACIQVELKDYPAALHNFEVSLNEAQKTGMRQVEMENYKNIADLYERTKNYEKHARYLKKYLELKDSIFNDESKNRIAQLETDYAVGKKNLEIEQKNSSILKQKNKINLFAALIVGATMLLLISLYLNNKIRKQKKVVEKQKEALHDLNKVKDRLFSVISHDLRNPLNALQSYLMLSDNESLSADKRLLFKNESIQAVAQTSNLLDNLLAWASMQLKDSTPKMIPLAILPLVEDVVNILQLQAKQKGIPIEVQLEDQKVISDEGILSIALRNILTNAIKFSKENQPIRITGFVSNQTYCLSIIDHGIGMSEKQIEAVLRKQNEETRTGTEGEKGSGLGMYLVVQLLNRIRIPLNMESKMNEGTTFQLNIPM